MVYKVILTSWSGINFLHYSKELSNAGVVFDSVSIYSKVNPKRILAIKILNQNEIEIEFYSKNKLTKGREANALWVFSHELVENQGFNIFVNSRGKLLKSA